MEWKAKGETNEGWQNSGQDQPHIRLDATDPHDHIHHLRLCLVEYDLASPASGEKAAYRAGSAAGVFLPGACVDQHSLHPGPLESGKEQAGRCAAPGGGNILFLAGFEHPLRKSLWSPEIISRPSKFNIV